MANRSLLGGLCLVMLALSAACSSHEKNTMTGSITTKSDADVPGGIIFCVGRHAALGDCFEGLTAKELSSFTIGSCVTVKYAAFDPAKRLSATRISAANPASNAQDCPTLPPGAPSLVPEVAAPTPT